MGMKYDSTNYTIQCGDYIIPVVRDRGYLFIRWRPSQTSTFFTLSELTKLYVRYGNPGWKRLYSFLKKESPDDMDDDSKAHLRRIEKACRTCQHKCEYHMSIWSSKQRFWWAYFAQWLAMP